MNYYKVTRQDETHRRMTYHDGLNEDPVTWNPSGDCEAGGIYFSREDILSFLDCGVWLRRVEIPPDTPIYENPGRPRKWKAPRILLGPREEITTEVILRLLGEGADIHAGNDYALCWAAESGQTETVAALLDRGADIHAGNDYALCWAAEYGHTETVAALRQWVEPFRT